MKKPKVLSPKRILTVPPWIRLCRIWPRWQYLKGMVIAEYVKNVFWFSCKSYYCSDHNVHCVIGGFRWHEDFVTRHIHFLSDTSVDIETKKINEKEEGKFTKTCQRKLDSQSDWTLSFPHEKIVSVLHRVKDESFCHNFSRANRKWSLCSHS